MPILLTWNPYFVESGLCPGVYRSREEHEQRVERLLGGIRQEQPALSLFDQDPWLDEGCGG